MKYLSLDIETSGLNPENCQILSVGAVIEDTNNPLSFREIPKFHAIILRDRIEGEPYAINLNRDLIATMLEYQLANQVKKAELTEKHGIFIPEDAIAGQLQRFLDSNGVLSQKISVAGKNFNGFDAKFLQKVVGFDKLNIHRRVIDPAPLFMDWKNDTELPDLNKCKQRAGFEQEVSHNALEDAWDVVVILRNKY